LECDDERLEEACCIEIIDYIKKRDKAKDKEWISRKVISKREAILLSLGVNPSYMSKERAFWYAPLSGYEYATDKNVEIVQASGMETLKNKHQKKNMKNRAEKEYGDLDELGKIEFYSWWDTYAVGRDTKETWLERKLQGGLYQTIDDPAELDDEGLRSHRRLADLIIPYSVSIEVTKRQLIEKGLDPELLNWQSIEKSREEQKSEVTTRDMLDAEKGEMSITKREMNQIKRLLNMIKDKFRGRE
jgi:hypothetical protein